MFDIGWFPGLVLGSLLDTVCEGEMTVSAWRTPGLVSSPWPWNSGALPFVTPCRMSCGISLK